MKTIFIVDQEKNTTFTLQKLLESEFFNVYSSYTLREAVSILNTQKFDLVVVSRDMPASDEFDIVQWLISYSPHTHIITLSSAEFTHSRAGQAIAKDMGFVDLNIKSFATGAVDAAGAKNSVPIRQYADSTRDAQRLSLNFRFKYNLAVLDNRGMRDLDRVVDYLKEALDKKILLSGFADNAGEYEYNRTLALERAETVAKELRSRGIAIAQVISVGEELPVASNATDQGREKNRRVEVWIK